MPWKPIGDDAGLDGVNPVRIGWPRPGYFSIFFGKRRAPYDAAPAAISVPSEPWPTGWQPVEGLSQLFDLPWRAPAMASAIPPAISTALTIGDTRSLLVVCNPMFISPALMP